LSVDHCIEQKSIGLPLQEAEASILNFILMKQRSMQEVCSNQATENL
jgi:hypothetical protein